MDERTIQGGPNDIQVYVGETGFVCIKQLNWPNDDSIVLVRKEDVSDLIEHLRETYQQAMDYVPPHQRPR